MAEVTVRDNPGESRFEAFVDGEPAGFAAYQKDGERIVFTHTEVDDAFEGHGVGSVLARTALDAVRAEGTHRVVPSCPFIARWIERHEDYRDLVAPGS
ncbi:GNAT family N-acetyltransferase [Nocardioides sp. SYSU D00038]|uniref:GNAT family N-acetyltransferase n=1 Tax=Nocardioides sp. SYSU D00038 TaxID=2812554 RepID=UPI001967DD52|nr:GNAT family N-acetyltransferase [Nocardioides sp. SYSU D00038]